VVNESDHPAAKKLVAALEAEKAFRIVTQFVNPDHSTRPLREDDVRPMIRNRDLHFALIIPTDVIPKNGLGLHLWHRRHRPSRQSSQSRESFWLRHHSKKR
jgi:ABC-2 type transport system permease protein